MKLSAYDEKIYQRMEAKLDAVLPYTVLIAMLSAVAIYVTEIPDYFIYANILVGIIMIMVYYKRKKLPREIKVAIIIGCAMGMGILSFMDGGFSSGAISLILLSNGIAILLLEKRQSMIIAGLSILCLIFLWIWSWKIEFVNPAPMHTGIWIIQILLVFLFVFLFRYAAYAIRNHLLENIEQLEHSMAYANELVYYDQLTKLPNYMAFSQFMQKTQEKQSTKGWIVLLSFKNLNIINSIYGNWIGDRILKTGTKYVMDTNREEEFLARTEGNQFALWVPFSDKMALDEALNRIELQLAKAFVDENLSNLLGYYIAYAKANFNKDTFDELYRKASLAMAEAKYSKIKSIVAYDARFENQLKRETYLMEQLKKDLTSFSHFKVVYQSQVQVDDLKIIGVEALSRWTTKKYGHISPPEFIEMINRIGLHREFGYFVLDRVMGDFEKLSKKYHPCITISVNIEPTYLMDTRFLEDIDHLLNTYSLQGNQLVLEITESVAMKGIDKVNEVLKKLKERGMWISLDDFGTGYSALNYLVNLEVNEVKIDKTLIDTITTNAKSQVMLSALKDLADEFDLRLIAEGVEEEEQYQMVKKMGYKIIQGYYFSKPEDML